MNAIALRYLSVVAITLFIFINFIACGSQLYQMSLEGDTSQEEGSSETRDPTSTLYGIHAQAGWVRLPIDYKFSEEIDADLKAQLTFAMSVWETAVGKKLFRYLGSENKRGDDFPSLDSSIVDGTNGHYLNFTWAKTGKSKQVLATTIWENMDSSSNQIKTSDIRYNIENYILGNSLVLRASESREVADLISLAIHEIGHLLGLSHVDSSVDRDSILNPYLYIGEGLISRSISRGDVERIQTIYSCQADACDIDATLEKLDAMEYREPVSLTH